MLVLGGGPIGRLDDGPCPWRGYVSFAVLGWTPPASRCSTKTCTAWSEAPEHEETLHWYDCTQETLEGARGWGGKPVIVIRAWVVARLAERPAVFNCIGLRKTWRVEYAVPMRQCNWQWRRGSAIVAVGAAVGLASAIRFDTRHALLTRRKRVRDGPRSRSTSTPSWPVSHVSAC